MGVGGGGCYFLISFLPLPFASQILRHQPNNYCRELTTAHSQQTDSSLELLASDSKSLTTKLRTLNKLRKQLYINDPTLLFGAGRNVANACFVIGTPLNLIYRFNFLILQGGLLVILTGFIILLLLFLDVERCLCLFFSGNSQNLDSFLCRIFSFDL